MKSSQLDAVIEAAIENLDDTYEYYGLRFEDKNRSIGDVCENSRHNPNRDDERDFPVYGTREYKKLPKLGGASSWYIDSTKQYKYSYWSEFQRRIKIDTEVPCEHCYIIASNDIATHEDCDQNEIVLVNAVVVAKIY